MAKSNFGKQRGNRYHTINLRLEPNSVIIDALEQGVVGSKPSTLEAKDGDVSDEEMAVILAGLAMADRVYERIHQQKEDELGIQGLKAPREKVHAFVKEMQDAKAAIAITELESIRIQNEQIVKRAELEQLDEHISRKRIEHQEVEKLRSDAVKGAQAEIAALDKAIAAKRNLVGRVELAAAVTESSAGGKDK